MTGLVASCRFFIAIVFALSAFPKLRNMESFAIGVAGYRILPLAWHRPVAWIVVLSELSAAALLVTPFSQLGALLVAGLSTIYGLAAGINLAKGRNIPCHCFDQGRSRLSWVTLLRLILIGGSALLIYRMPTRYSFNVSEWIEILSYLVLELLVFSVLEVVQFALTTSKQMLKQY